MRHSSRVLNQAHALLLTETGTAEDRFTDYEKNKAQFTERLTYGFDQIASTTEPMVVPKGAEVLLETRQPYLTDEQRRAVLATTGISSGYPVLMIRKAGDVLIFLSQQMAMAHLTVM